MRRNKGRTLLYYKMQIKQAEREKNLCKHITTRNINSMRWQSLSSCNKLINFCGQDIPKFMNSRPENSYLKQDIA